MSQKKNSKPPQKKSRADKRRDLARLICAVMNHPALPADLRQDFYEALNEFENTIDLNKLCYSEDALTHAFELRTEAERTKGGAR